MPPKKSNLNNASSKGSRRKRVERAQQLPEQIETRNATQRFRTAESRAQESQEQRDERLQQNITRTRAARERNIATVRVLDRQRQRISRSLTRASFVRLAFEYAPDINYSAHSKIAIGGMDKNRANTDTVPSMDTKYSDFERVQQDSKSIESVKLEVLDHDFEKSDDKLGAEDKTMRLIFTDDEPIKSEDKLGAEDKTMIMIFKDDEGSSSVFIKQEPSPELSDVSVTPAAPATPPASLLQPSQIRGRGKKAAGRRRGRGRGRGRARGKGRGRGQEEKRSFHAIPGSSSRCLF